MTDLTAERTRKLAAEAQLAEMELATRHATNMWLWRTLPVRGAKY